MPRLPLLLAITTVGSLGALGAGQHLLRQRAPLTPELATPTLQWIWRLDPNPGRRREAALLLLGRGEDRGDAAPPRQRQLLRNQGWGNDPLAALVLKRDAQAATRLGQQTMAERRWQQLLARFPADPASADALYALGRQQPERRGELLQRFPAHPAALAAAVELGPAGALHLARWGERWPGAGAVLRERCRPEATGLSDDNRDQIAAALARLGSTAAAEDCLAGRAGSPTTQLALARASLHDPDQEARAERQLAALARQAPQSEAAREAVRLLSAGRSAVSLEALAGLPATLQESAPVQARRALAAGRAALASGNRAPAAVDRALTAATAVLRRWPEDPASWELQWQLARQLALQGDWARSLALLQEPALRQQLPPLLESRRWFWEGLAAWELGEDARARQLWRALLSHHPGGYYGWRAAVRLGEAEGSLLSVPPERVLPARRWHPLESGNGRLDQLWRLGQPLEAWEHWRLLQGGTTPQAPAALVVEGRLRRSVGDDWLGLGLLEQASLRLPPQACDLAVTLERELHSASYRAELEAAARAAALPAPLLAAVAKQESRFSSSVRSPVGAVGLLQLMPATANEVAGMALSEEQLEQPARNAELGARYLDMLLAQWQQNLLLAVASYNAGPNAVRPWINPTLAANPELWVEAIPFPETRLYVKKVLGNAWSMTAARPPRCGVALSPPASGPAPRR